ncbi:hypothetical protein HYC85_014625, partial [Camellia sinensis]
AFVIRVQRTCKVAGDKKKGGNFENCGGREAADAMAREAKKNELIFQSSSIVNVDGLNNFASFFSKRGEKLSEPRLLHCVGGIWMPKRHDVLWGHGPWGHFVAKRVRETMPLTLLCTWQETLVEASVDYEFDLESDKKLHSLIYESNILT